VIVEGIEAKHDDEVEVPIIRMYHPYAMDKKGRLQKRPIMPGAYGRRRITVSGKDSFIAGPLKEYPDKNLEPQGHY
jgi:hypothetical protein